MCYGTDCVMDLNKFGRDVERSCICNATDYIRAYLQKEAEGCRDERMLGRRSRCDPSVTGRCRLAQISFGAFLTARLLCKWHERSAPIGQTRDE